MSSRARRKASSQNFHPLVELGPAQHSASHSPIAHCVGPHGFEPCGQMQRSQEKYALCNKNSKGLENTRGQERTPLFRRLNISNLHSLTWPMSSSQVSLTYKYLPYGTQTVLGMCLFFPCPVPFPRDLGGIDLGSVKA